MSAEITKADIATAVFRIDENQSAADFAVKETTKKNLEYLKNNNLHECKPLSLWQLLGRAKFWLKILNYLIANHQVLITILKKIK